MGLASISIAFEPNKVPLSVRAASESPFRMLRTDATEPSFQSLRVQVIKS